MPAAGAPQAAGRWRPDPRRTGQPRRGQAGWNPRDPGAVGLRNGKETIMDSASPPIDLPDDLRRGLDIAAGEAGRTPTEIVIEALESLGIERLSEDQFQKRLTGSQ